MKATLLNDRKTIALEFPYNPRVVGVVKRIPGRMYDAKRKLWYFAMDGMVNQYITALKAVGFNTTEVERGLLPPERITPVLEPPIASMYPFQAEMCREIVSKGSCCVTSFCGSGKTITALGSMKALGAQNVLIVCPKSVLWNWHKEITKWLNFPSLVIEGSPAERRKLYSLYSGGYIITTYDQLRIDLEHYASRRWDAVIVDEAHYLVNTTSLRHKAVASLVSPVKIGLTATPIMNSATDIYGVMKALGRNLGNYKLFLDRYVARDMWGGVKYYRNMDELKARIRPWLVSKTLEEAQFQLPPRTDVDLEFELNEKESSLYDRMKQEILFSLEKEEVSKLSSPVILQNTLVKMGKLIEVCDSLELVGDLKDSSKIETLKELVDSILS